MPARRQGPAETLEDTTRRARSSREEARLKASCDTQRWRTQDGGCPPCSVDRPTTSTAKVWRARSAQDHARALLGPRAAAVCRGRVIVAAGGSPETEPADSSISPTSR